MDAKKEVKESKKAMPGGTGLAVLRNFDRAASTYDRFADVQIEVAERLIKELPPEPPPSNIIELGCGTGNLTSRLGDKYPTSSIIAIDFAAEMVKRAALRLGDRQVQFLCHGIEGFLDGYGKKADLIVSNATLQWVDGLEAVLAQARQHLQENGLLAFSIFGPESLVELQQALDAVMPGKATLAARYFKDGVEITRFLARNFAKVESKTIIIKREYPTVLALLRQIRKTGTGGRHRLPLHLNRGRLQKLDAWFEKRYGGCRVSYQVLFFRCRP